MGRRVDKLDGLVASKDDIAIRDEDARNDSIDTLGSERVTATKSCRTTRLRVLRLQCHGIHFDTPHEPRILVRVVSAVPADSVESFVSRWGPGKDELIRSVRGLRGCLQLEHARWRVLGLRV